MVCADAGTGTRRVFGFLFRGVEISYLAGRDELQRAESSLEVGSVGLKVVEGASDGGLKLRRVLARGAVGRDLVELRGRHFGDCRYRVDRSVVVDCKSLKAAVVMDCG